MDKPPQIEENIRPMIIKENKIFLIQISFLIGKTKIIKGRLIFKSF